MIATRLAAGLSRLALIGTAAVLFACGGGGGGEDVPAGPLPSKVFAGDFGHSAIGSVINPDPPPGPLVVDRIIQGPSAGLGLISSFALDTANDRLYVATGAIRVFNGASFADGNVAPVRTIFAGSPGSLFLDTAHDRLYVGDTVAGVRVLNNASTINGTVSSDRLITGFDHVLGVQVDTTRDILYVSNSTSTGAYQISVFDGASTVVDAAPVNRVITPHLGATDMPVSEMFLDAANDRLYVAGGTNYNVMVFELASAANGVVIPSKSLIFPTSTGVGLKSVVVDKVHNRLYTFSSSVIYALSNASAASGSVTGKAALAPAGTLFAAIAVSP